MTTIENLSPPAVPVDTDAFANILNMVRRRLYFILGFVALCTAVTAIVTSHLKPLYRADLDLLIDPHNARVNDVQTLATQSIFVDATLIRDQIAILWSEDLARKVVTSLNLQATPDFQPGFSKFFKPLAPDNLIDRGLMVLTRGAAYLLGHHPERRDQEAPGDSLDATVETYLGRISAVNDGRSYVITLRVTSSDPSLAVQIAKAHAQAYFDRQLELKTAQVKNANSSVSSQLDSLASKLAASEQALQAFKKDSSLIGPDSPGIISQEITDLTQKLIAVRSDIADKEARLHALQILLNDPASKDISTLATSATYERLRAKEQDLLQQQSEIQATFGPAYPSVTQIQQEITTTGVQLKSEVRQLIQAASAEVSASRAQEAQLVAALDTARAGVQRQDSAAPDLHSLEAEVAANRTVYDAFLTRMRQLSAQESVQQPDASAIGEPIRPRAPYFPNKLIILAGGFLGSGGLAIVIALALGFTAGGFDTLAQVERTCNAPGFGVIPLVRPPRRQVGVDAQITGASRSHYSERVRMIRNSLALALRPRHRGQVVLLTSSLPKEGKSSCAVALAMSVAAAGRKVLLVDADLRKPSIGRILGADTNQPGLGNLIEGTAKVDETIQLHPRTGLHYIPAGQASATTLDRANFDLTGEFFDTIRGLYEYIFIDSPPIIAVSDALWLAHEADATLFLVRWQSTPRSAVRAAVQKLRDTGTEISGVLLTLVDIEKSGSLTPSDFDYYMKEVSQYYTHR